MLHPAITKNPHPTRVNEYQILSLPLALNKERVESHLDH